MSGASIVAFTLSSAVLSTAIVIPVGLTVDWLLARFQWPGKTIVETLFAMPLVMPPVATGLILLKLLGRRGFLGRLLDRAGIEVVFTWRAVVAAMVVMSMPLFIRAARVALEEVNVRYEHVARTLGASEARVFFRVTMPLALRGIAAGALLAFARATGEFGATILVAGNIPGKTQTIALAIYQDVQLGRDSDAYHFLLASVVIAFVALWINEAITRRRAA